MVTAAMKLKDACSLGKKAMKNLDNILKRENIDSNQSILKEIIPEYSLEGLMLKLKF